MAARRRMRGFSLLEMVAVVAIILIACAITFVTLQPALQDSHVNAAYSTVLTQLRTARQRSISERKRYIVIFVPPQTIQVYRWDVGVPVSPAPLLLNSIDLPTDVQFTAVAGLPTGPASVPDGFGTGGTAIDFDQGVGAGNTTEVMFMPDGSSRDRQGNLNSGIVYVARPNELYSSRAVTVFGSTGRIRGWRLVDRANTPTWIEE